MKTLWLALLLSAACSAPSGAYDLGPTLSQTSRIATHNSYWVNRGAPGDIGSSGVGEQILDQLLIDHVRALELDIHPDPATPHHFLIYHTAPGNDVCTDLADCLAPVLALHDLVVSHAAIVVILELKGLITPTFDDSHTPEDLDGELQQTLGALLYTPAELLAQCDVGSTLVQCVRDHGWPYEGALTGRVLVAVLGNWDGLPGAVAPADWAKYATAAPITSRVAFLMGSSWQRDYATLSDDNHAAVTGATWEAAWAQAAMLQVESFDDPLLKPGLAQNQIVRADGVFAATDRATATALGIQLWQTDWPWDAARTTTGLGALPGEPTPSDILDVDGSAKVPLPTTGQLATFAWFPAQSDSDRLYAAMATGLAQGVTTCLAAAIADQPDVDGATWCKHKTPAVHAKPGDDAPANPNGERVTYIWQVCHAGACAAQTLDPQAQAVALDVACSSGQCCVTPQWLGPGKTVTAAAVAGAASNACFAAAGLAQGLLARWDPTVDHAHDAIAFVGGLLAPLP